MKKTRIILSAMLIIAAIFAMSMTIFADNEATPVDSREKDGLKAELIVTNNETEPEKIDLLAKIENQSGDNLSNIKIETKLPEGIVLSSGDLAKDLTIAVGESVEYALSLTNTAAIPETEPETTPGTTPETTPVEQKGCKSAIVSAVSVIAVAGAALVLTKKNKKAVISCLMLGAMLFGMFAFAVPTSAATTRRSFDLVATITYEEKEYPITVTVSYDHTFTSEAESKKATGFKEFDITYYFGPQGEYMNEENIKLIAEAGFTSIPVETSHGAGTAYFKSALEIMRKYGLTCSALQDPRMSNLVYAAGEVTQEQFDQAAKEIVEDYKDYLDVIEGWWIRDEPGADNFEKLGMAVKAFKKYTPDKETMINLFPTYARNDQLGTNGYQEYLDKFVEIVDPSYISYDNYKGAGMNNTDFFNNLELVRKKSIESGIDPMNILLLTQHQGYGNLTYDQIEWQVNVSIAYGMKRVSYFTYWLDEHLLNNGWSNACADINGTIYQHYYDVQKINKWLNPLGTELFNKNSTAVYHISETKGAVISQLYTFYDSYGDLGEVKASNFLVGFFDDGSFMIANKDYKAEEKVEFIDGKPNLYEIYDSPFVFIDIDSGLQYFNTDTATWCDAEADGVVFRNADGKLEKNFEIAEGMLFRVAD